MAQEDDKISWAVCHFSLQPLSRLSLVRAQRATVVSWCVVVPALVTAAALLPQALVCASAASG